MPGEPFVSPGEMVLSLDQLGDVQVSDPNAKYRDEFRATKYDMTEEQCVSLRRAEDGLEPFIPTKPASKPTDVHMNPLASEL